MCLKWKTKVGKTFKDNKRNRFDSEYGYDKIYARSEKERARLNRKDRKDRRSVHEEPMEPDNNSRKRDY